MAKRISLNPEILNGQSSEMTKLKNDYENLFSNITKTLNETNSNWSDNLARNFVGKINSAQKSFSMVVNELENGANAAKNSAETMQNIDIELSKQISGDSGEQKKNIKADGSLTGKDKTGKSKVSKTQTKEELLKEGWEALPKEVREEIEKRGADLKNLDKWLDEHYDTLPEFLREPIEKVISGKVKDAITIIREIASGEQDYDTLLKVTNLVSPTGVSGAALYGTFRSTWEAIDKFNENQAYYEEISSQRLHDKDYIGAFGTLIPQTGAYAGLLAVTIPKALFYTGEGLIKNFGLDDPLSLVSSVFPVDSSVKVSSPDNVDTFIGSW